MADAQCHGAEKARSGAAGRVQGGSAVPGRSGGHAGARVTLRSAPHLLGCSASVLWGGACWEYENLAFEVCLVPDVSL